MSSVRSRQSSVAAAARFHARVAELGGTVVGTYVRTKVPVAVRCPEGHVNEVWPAAVLRGSGICCTCIYAGWRSASEAEFRARVAELGGTVLGAYEDSKSPVLVQCDAGHRSRPRPFDLQQGRGICRTCAGQDPAVAGAAFMSRMAAVGATVLGAYVNAHTPVPAVCAGGHEVLARPNDVGKGIGICRTCAGQDPAVAEAAFRARLAELGAVLLEPVWLGSMKPHRVRCPTGHEAKPRPAMVMQGQGICRRCKGMHWDAFYVVTSETAVKFGITSGNARPRLRVHSAAGYREVVRLLTALPGDKAPELEQAVLSTLRLARIEPVKGREYFDMDALALVLDIVDNYPLDELRSAS